MFLDTFLLFRRKIATYTALQRPQSAIQILDDSSSTASVNLPSSLSVSSSVRQPSSLSSSSVNIALSSRRTVRAHNASLLRRLDKNKKAEVSLRYDTFCSTYTKSHGMYVIKKNEMYCTFVYNCFKVLFYVPLLYAGGRNPRSKRLGSPTLNGVDMPSVTVVG